MDRDAAVDLAIALFQAADEDSATGGPDLVQGIYPVVATITAEGFERLGDDDVAEHFQALDEGSPRPAAPPRGAGAVHGGGDRAMTMPFYVPAEQMMKDKADRARTSHGARPWSPLYYADGILIAAENVGHAAQGQRDLRPHRLRRQVQRVRPPPHRRRAADLKGYSYCVRTSTPRASPTPTPRCWATCSPTRSSPWRSRSSWPSWAPARTATGCSTSSTTARWSTRRASPSWAGARSRPSASSAGRQSYEPGSPLDEALQGPRSAPWPATATSPPPSWRSPCWPGQRAPRLPPPVRRGRGGHAGEGEPAAGRARAATPAPADETCHAETEAGAETSGEEPGRPEAPTDG